VTTPCPTRLAALALVALAACTPPTAAPVPSLAETPTSEVGAPATEQTEPNTSAPTSTEATLARLAIDDRPFVGAPYRREDWPHWRDPDGNGCDAREDALIAASTMPATVGAGCKVTAGRWPLVYVPGETTVPGDIDIDHLVPLSGAHHSRGATWSTEQRMAYANDPAVLWAVDDGANQSKGDRGPESWRPEVRDVWCTYASRWVAIKVTYGLTATSAERDALGQMLEEC
jgi:hypothetical protein